MRSVPLRAILVAAAWLGLSGCGGPYVLRGRVVDGGFSSVVFVDGEDRQLGEAGTGIPSARIAVFRDPRRLNRSLVATGPSDPEGSFAIPLSVFGAGWMDEIWLIQVTCPDFETVESMVRLPTSGADARALIVLRPGVSIVPPVREDYREQAERFR